MKITKDFFKSVPIEKRNLVEKKINEFSFHYDNAKSLSDIPSGFDPIKINNCNILKFRVNDGDRILFKILDNGEILFIQFANHDSQIRKARQRKQFDSVDYSIVSEEEINSFDDQIDYYAQTELQNMLHLIEQNNVVDKETITYIIEDPNLDEINYLTSEQFNILAINNNTIIVVGCAGSGKTSIGIRKILLNEELKRETTYISHSKNLVKSIEATYESYNSSKEYSDFQSLSDFFLNILKKDYTVIEEYDFINWSETNPSLFDIRRDISLTSIYNEITSVIKGSLSEKNLLSETEYLQLDSPFSVDERKYLYFIATQYNKWLEKNNYFDLNDLARLSENYTSIDRDIIIDEMQEFTDQQFYSLNKLVSTNSRILMLGDYYQAIWNYNYSISKHIEILTMFNRAHSIAYLQNNFRSGHETIKLLNQIKHHKQSYNPLNEFNEEFAVRKSSKPNYTVEYDNFYKLADKINLDADSMIITTTQKNKDYLIDLGFDRILLVHEIQGLQYSNVYCFDVISNDKSYTSLLNNKERVELDSLLFNKLYLAASRATNNLSFIEKKESALLKKYYSLLDKTDIKSISYGLSNVSTEADWASEGYKLKLFGKYEQALDAFKKAQLSHEVKICENLIEREKNHALLDEYSTFVQLVFGNLKPHDISKAMTYINKKYNIKILGRVTYYYTELNRAFNITKSEYVYLTEEDTVKNFGSQLYSTINSQFISKDSIFFKGVFYDENNNPIKLTSLNGNENKNLDIKIFMPGDNLIFDSFTNLSFERSIANKKEYFEETKYSAYSNSINEFNVNVHVENNKKNMSAEEIIEYIINKEQVDNIYSDLRKNHNQ